VAVAIRMLAVAAGNLFELDQVGAAGELRPRLLQARLGLGNPRASNIASTVKTDGSPVPTIMPRATRTHKPVDSTPSEVEILPVKSSLT
jgi:hypothetical protein